MIRVEDASPIDDEQYLERRDLIRGWLVDRVVDLHPAGRARLVARRIGPAG